ncbi:type VI secretion system protein TssL, long form [Burkholderia sp. JSH-S8]|nr:type VI secretion system protein TssL, long form [Burkholderia sp. JSH-S8]
MTQQAYGDDAFAFLSEPLARDPASAQRAPGAPARVAFDPNVDAEQIAFDPPEDLQVRQQRMQAAQNPLLEAAGPLLRMLADMPASLESQPAVDGLRALLMREVIAFQKLCDKENLPWKHMAAARYCLCTALDEAANRTQWGGSAWAVKSLLFTFEGEVDGGEKFFLLIGRMAMDPQTYVDVLEVLFRILGLGFGGRYSVIADGRRHLEQIRQRLLALISSVREDVPLDLSQHWRGAPPGKLRSLTGIPVWATGSAAALVVLTVFAWDKYRLLSASAKLEARIAAIGSAPAPAPKKPRLRLPELLKDEISRDLVAVDDGARRSVVVFRGDSMFVAGQSRVRPEMEPILSKVAQEVARVGGNVTVIGHTDSQPVRTAEFPDNQVLSEKRAAFVADILMAHGTPAARIRGIGKGASEPVAGNTTADDRARNRRVEIVVTQ